ncbi:hypothetical protein [Methanorbis rubei]|uniref:Uncharacterized protein n=1 Tax=Methanorbis rubei TaxID=3028300 RepID=A0AAE4MHN7_9EURY|nr:hypothetical protein [Methanocorpusculaceae archaeon Cs1]
MKRHAYTNLTDEEYQNLGKLVKNMGYQSRSAYYTAVSRVTLYGCHAAKHHITGDLDPPTIQWIAARRSAALAHDLMWQTYFDILSELAFPVIASRGAQTAYELLFSELQSAMTERLGRIPTIEQMRVWIQAYETTYADQLAEHRAELNRELRQEVECLSRDEMPEPEEADD